MADQHAAVNTFPGLVHTARHTTEAGSTRSRYPNPGNREGGAYGGAGDWGEVVTRYPYRKVGVDHLLSKEINSLNLKLWALQGAIPNKFLIFDIPIKVNGQTWAYSSA